MSDQRISFEAAKLAKSIGFKDECNSYYFEDGEFKENELIGTNGYYGEDYCFDLNSFEENWNNNWLSKKDGCKGFGVSKSAGYFETFSAPTQTYLQKWLREKYNIIVWISFNPAFDIPYMSHVARPGKGSSLTTGYRDTYEKALESALIEALKLIN